MVLNSTDQKAIVNYNYYIIGICSVLAFIISIPVNSVLAWTIYRNKKLHNALNYLILAVSVSNLVGSIIQFPLLSINLFSERFIFDQPVCDFTAFVLFFNSSHSIHLLTFVSIERYLFICKPFITYVLNGKRCIAIIVYSIIVSCIIFGLPIFTKSYGLDSAGVTCVIKLTAAHWTFIVLYLFVLPLFILFFANIKMITKVRQSSKRVRRSDNISRNRLKKESHLIKVTILIIVSFLATYLTAFATGTIMLVYPPYLSALLQIINGLILRTSMIWPSMIYMFMNKDIKKNLFFYKNNRIGPDSIEKY